MKLYYSSRQAADIPTLKSYGDRVQGLLREFATASGGKLSLQVVDPEPFSETEDEAVAAGLQGAMLSDAPTAKIGAVKVFSTKRACPVCGTSYPELDPRMFSYNSKHGWCGSCVGTGQP